MSRVIRIGTRGSELALWQANAIKSQLEQLGHPTLLVPIQTAGDVEQEKPLSQLGLSGVFTKALDEALLKGFIDIAVHSLKDAPTKLPKGIVQAAVLKRGRWEDVLVYKTDLSFLEKAGIVATGSLRRTAQWLGKYPHHSITGLRGNIQTRLQKLADNSWDGALFAAAGLERLNALPQKTLYLDWMLPAPAQGIIAAFALEADTYICNAMQFINHPETEMCAHIERSFLNTLEGGCTAPIAALAHYAQGEIHFKGALFSEDGSVRIEVALSTPVAAAKNIGQSCALEILKKRSNDSLKNLKHSNI